MGKLPFIPRLCNSIVKRVGGYRVVRVQEQGEFSVSSYWENRYAQGGNSGAGSYGRLAVFKADVINSFVKEKGIHSVIELGCGDGNQLALANYPQYAGVDISQSSIRLCREKFVNDETKRFEIYDSTPSTDNAELALSLDVIYHLVEDEVYTEYMSRLFVASSKYVIVYASDIDEYACEHVRHRKFTRWVEENCPSWRLIKHIPNKYRFNASDPSNTSFSDFYIYKKV